jgi:two-component system, NarL family, nitrate/nitrite response regulator NarL
MNTQIAQPVIKIQLIDPHQITLWGINQFLSSNEGIQICASSSSGIESLKLAASKKPDVIVLEPDLQEQNGLELITALLKVCEAKIIIFTGSRNAKIHDEAVVKGARGVINKTEPIENLVKAIEKIHEGELWLNRSATSRILLQIAQANSPSELSIEQKKLASLTPKEEKVTRAIQLHSEKTLKQVSDSLHISEHTLRNHLASIYDKLGVRNRMELYVFCGKFQKTENPNMHPKRRSTDL